MARTRSSRRSSAERVDERRPRVLLLASDVLFSMFFPPATIARLEHSAEWQRYAKRADSVALGEAIARSDALVTTWHSPFLRAERLSGSPVRLIVHCGGELAARMEAAVLDCVTVVTTPGPMAAPVAEMALAMVLSLVRRLPEYDRSMRGGAVPDNAIAPSGETLAGRRIGVIGLGRIGRAFARLLGPFDVDLVAYDPHCAAAAARACGATFVALDELLRSATVVVVAAALTRETEGLLDRRRLSLLPDGACLVNVARGALVDLPALVAELRSGRIAAALDVTDPLEPLPEGHELRRLPNALLTPHVAAGGLEVRRAMGAAAVDAIERFACGRRPQHVVTRAMLARMT
jgi:phosphoglycerate dehydrogenase-like enzyme